MKRYLNREVNFSITKIECYLLLTVFTDDGEYIKERYSSYNKREALLDFNKKHKYQK